MIEPLTKKERQLLAAKRWRERHRAELNARAAAERKRRWAENPAEESRKMAAYNAKKRQLTLDMLGGRCAKCGFDDARALQIDHVRGDGFIGKRSRSANFMYNEVMNDTEGRFQILCANCNVIKARENREYQQGWRNRKARQGIAWTHIGHDGTAK